MSQHCDYSSAEQPAVPVFDMACKKGTWWSIPADMSQRMYENYKNNEDVGYRRSVRLVWVHADKLNPIWTGEKPAGALLEDQPWEVIDGSDMAPADTVMKPEAS